MFVLSALACVSEGHSAVSAHVLVVFALSEAAGQPSEDAGGEESHHQTPEHSGAAYEVVHVGVVRDVAVGAAH